MQMEVYVRAFGTGRKMLAVTPPYGAIRSESQPFPRSVAEGASARFQGLDLDFGVRKGSIGPLYLSPRGELPADADVFRGGYYIMTFDDDERRTFELSGRTQEPRSHTLLCVDSTPEHTSQPMTEQTSQPMPEQMAQPMPEQMSQPMPEQMSQPMPEQMAQLPLSQQVQTPEQASENCSPILPLRRRLEVAQSKPRASFTIEQLLAASSELDIV